MEELKRSTGAPVVIYNLRDDELFADLNLADDAIRAADVTDNPSQEEDWESD